MLKNRTTTVDEPLAVVGQGEVLVDRLRARMRPPDDGRPVDHVVVLGHWSTRSLAVDLARRRDERRDPRTTREREHLARSIDVGLDRADGLLDHEPDPHRRREVVDGSEASGIERRQHVGHRPLVEVEPVAGFQRMLEIAPPARREVVHHGHRLALREEVIDQVRADEACTTGHEYGRSRCHDEECPSGLRDAGVSSRSGRPNTPRSPRSSA